MFLECSDPQVYANRPYKIAVKAQPLGHASMPCKASGEPVTMPTSPLYSCYQARQFGQTGGIRLERGVANGWLFGTQLAQHEFLALMQVTERIQRGQNFKLQGVEQAAQTSDFARVAKIKTSPASAQNKTMRVVGNVAQARDVAISYLQGRLAGV